MVFLLDLVFCYIFDWIGSLIKIEDIFFFYRIIWWFEFWCVFFFNLKIYIFVNLILLGFFDKNVEGGSCNNRDFVVSDKVFKFWLDFNCC